MTMSDESARVKKWKLANPDKVREQKRRYSLKNRAKQNKYHSEYMRRLREKARKYDEQTGGAEE